MTQQPEQSAPGITYAAAASSPFNPPELGTTAPFTFFIMFPLLSTTR